MLIQTDNYTVRARDLSSVDIVSCKQTNKQTNQKKFPVWEPYIPACNTPIRTFFYSDVLNYYAS